VLVTGCLSLLEDIQIVWSLLLPSYSFGSVLYHCTGGADKSLAPQGRKQATATEDFGFHISYL
jgi:hypothetical protein